MEIIGSCSLLCLQVSVKLEILAKFYNFVGYTLV